MSEYHWHSSKTLLGLFIVFYCLAVLVIASLPIGIIGQLILFLSLSIYAIYVLLKHILFYCGSAWVGLRKTELDWLILKRNGQCLEIQLIPASCVVWSSLVVICFRLQGAWFTSSICLPFDAMSSDDFRRLKVYLRFKGNSFHG